MIGQYLEEFEKVRALGKTKRATLLVIAGSWIGDLQDVDITSQKLVEYAQWRHSKDGGGVQAQTIGNDLSHLVAVLSIARPAWGYEIDPFAVPDARDRPNQLEILPIRGGIGHLRVAFLH
jgi:hypothetical protein